jgi:uncharacterized protein YraI
MKLYIIITLLVSIFSYIDQPCSAGKYGNGVCVKKSSCTLYGRQQGTVFSYVGKAPNWPCPNDPSDVICCVKEVTRLKDGVTNKKGRCLNINQCKGSTINTGECPGSNNVKLCVANTKTIVNSVYKINAGQGGKLNIRSGDDISYNKVGTIDSGQYIFVTSISSNGWAQFYKGYVSSKYLTKVSSNVNYKVNTGALNFRSGPGTSYNILVTLNNGFKIIYYSRDPWNSNWAVTNKGYCSVSYITKINNSPTPAPTPTPTPTTKTNAGEISTKFDGTVLNRNSFINKVSSYCKNHPGTIAIALCNNAGTVYDVSKSSNVNALLVIARAIVEGNSPGASKNNYWGIGCVNGGGTAACYSYSSLSEGVKGFAKTVSKYNNLAEMASKYAYIGKYWYNPGSWANGGCIYFPSIKQYMSAQRRQTVTSICNKTTKCTTNGGDCTLTTKEDQTAYATWQVEKKMGPQIRNVFGVY